MGGIASNEYGVSRVWTQVVSDWLATRGRIGKDYSDDLALKLLVAGYSFTSLRPSAIPRAAQKSTWKTNDEPLRTVTEYLTAEGIDGQKIWLVTGQGIALLWRNATIDSAAADVTRAMLEAIAKRADGVKIIGSIRGSLDAFFGLDVVNARKAKTVIDDWRGENPGGAIVIP